MINNNHCPTAPTLAPKGHVPNGTGCPIGGGGVNIGVTWFYQPKIITDSPSLNSLNNNRSSSKSTTENNTVSNRDSIDLIDIEDEDHSFAAFFIGMKTGPSPYVKRPLVCIECAVLNKIFLPFFCPIFDDFFNPDSISYVRPRNCN